MICEKCDLEKTKKIQSNGKVIHFCSNCYSASLKVRHAKRKEENPNPPIIRTTMCKICNIPKDIIEKNGYLRCSICKERNRTKSLLTHPQKSRAIPGAIIGRPPAEILFCEKHDCVKETLNSNGYRICIFCSREATRKSYFKDHEKSLKLKQTKNKRNKLYLQQWYKNNKVRILIRNKNWIMINKKYHQELKRKWRENNPEKMRQYCNNWRSFNKNAEGSHTAEQWLEVCELQNNLCNICNQPRKLERDHIIPLSKGGSNYIENIQGLCRSCNASKADKLISRE